MAEFETKLIGQSRIKPIEWKRYIDDVFSLWNKSKQDINLFIEQANQFHPSIKFTAEISENEITFLDTIIYKGDRFQTDSILDIKTHYKPTETFQYTHFTSCQRCIQALNYIFALTNVSFRNLPLLYDIIGGLV